MYDPSKERTCFNCAYGEIRCTNARGKFYDKPVLDILICGAWREKNKISAEDFIKAFGGKTDDKS